VEHDRTGDRERERTGTVMIRNPNYRSTKSTNKTFEQNKRSQEQKLDEMTFKRSRRRGR
jgi:hypothetical protein